MGDDSFWEMQSEENWCFRVIDLTVVISPVKLLTLLLETMSLTCKTVHAIYPPTPSQCFIGSMGRNNPTPKKPVSPQSEEPQLKEMVRTKHVATFTMLHHV